MCQKRSNYKVWAYSKNGKQKKISVDGCLKSLIPSLVSHGYRTVGCCCGHGKYPLTVVCRDMSKEHGYYELISGVSIPRKTRYYLKDKQGFYYIPEVVDKLKKEKNGIKI